MKLSDYYSKLEKSKEYRDFMEQNKSAYLCSCFFMIDRENNTQEIHFDYYIDSEKKIKNPAKPSPDHPPHQNNKEVPPSIPPTPHPSERNSVITNLKEDKNNEDNEETKKQKGQIYVFKITDKLSLAPLEFFDNRIPEKLILDKNFGLEEFENLIEEKMQKENIKEKAKKFLYSLHITNGKKLLLVTVFLSNLALLKVSIDISNMEIIDFQKKSFFDMFKILKK
jgi:hypothetical protein